MSGTESGTVVPESARALLASWIPGTLGPAGSVASIPSPAFAVAAGTDNNGPPSGRKDDLGKFRYDLVPPLAEEQMVAVLTFGAKKYTPDGWRTVPNGKTRYYAALRRHVAKWAMGEKLDPESGLPHLAHALCCLAFLAELDAQ